MVMKLACVVVTLATGWTFLGAGPQDEKKPATQDEKKPPAAETPTPEQIKEMMALFEKAAEPGEEHKLLGKLAGKWNTVAKSSGMPGVPPEETKGTAERRAILGGRQVLEESHGSMMGKPFDGFQILGYDNVTKEFVSTWTDTMSTGQFQTRGKADATGKVITLDGVVRDAMSPVEPRAWRLVVKIESDDRHVIDVYDTTAPNTLTMVVSLTYARAK